MNLYKSPGSRGIQLPTNSFLYVDSNNSQRNRKSVLVSSMESDLSLSGIEFICNVFLHDLSGMYLRSIIMAANNERELHTSYLLIENWYGTYFKP